MALFQDGNSKVSRNVPTFNLPFGNHEKTGTCLPTAMCAKTCYCIGTNRKYPNTKPSRLRSLIASKASSFVADAVKELAHKFRNRNGLCCIRWHGEGDIYSEEYSSRVDQIIRKVADTIKPKAKLKTLIYTTRGFHSIDYLDGVRDGIERLKLNPSVSLYQSCDDSRPEPWIDGVPVAFMTGSHEKAAELRSRGYVDCPCNLKTIKRVCGDKCKICFLGKANVIFMAHGTDRKKWPGNMDERDKIVTT